MKRRSFFKTVGASGLAAAGLAVGSTPTAADPEVTTEVVAPKEGIRGLGNTGEWFFSVHPFGAHSTGDPYWYYFAENGNIEGSGGFGERSAQGRYGCARSDEAAYVGYYDEIQEFTDTGEVIEHTAPAEIQSLAYDDESGQLWGGGENGRVWQFDDQITVEQSFAFPGSVFGLAHDGEYLWAVTTESGKIMQVDPSSGDIEEAYGYPVSVTIYDLTYLDDRLWLAGDGRLYGTNISASMATETPTATQTSTPTDSSPRRIDEAEVTSEVVAPKEGIRGIGWYDAFYSVHPSDVHDTGDPYWYLFDESGSIESSGEFGDEGSAGRYGLAVGDETTYISRYDEIIEYTRSDPITHSVPAEVHSLTYDDAAGQLWAGGANGRVWQFDDQITVEQTLTFSGSVGGLAHDGEYLWVGTSDNSHIRRVDPATGDVDESFDPPVSTQIYSFLYQGDRLWLAGDGRVYQTNLSTTATAEQATPEPTPTPTPTDTPTATRTPTATADQQTADSPPGPGGSSDDNPFEPPDSDGTETASATESPEPTQTLSPEPTQTESPTTTSGRVDERTETPGGKTEPDEDRPGTTVGSGPGMGIVSGLAALGVGAWRFSESESE